MYVKWVHMYIGFYISYQTFFSRNFPLLMNFAASSTVLKTWSVSIESNGAIVPIAIRINPIKSKYNGASMLQLFRY